MKNYLRTWNFKRIVQLAIGLFIIGYAIQDGIWPLAALGGLYSLMALLNVGCCSSSGCYTPNRRTYRKVEDVTYEEVR